LAVLRLAIERFAAADGAQAAASLSYYAFFSLFPLLLFILMAAGLLIGRQSVHDQLLRALEGVLPTPFARDLVSRTIDQVALRSGSLQLLAALGLVWAGAGFFTALVRNIDLAWPEIQVTSIVRRRLYGLLMVGIVTILLLVSVATNLLLEVLDRTQPFAPVGKALLEHAFLPIASHIVPEVMTVVLLFGLYWSVPKTRVRWQAAVWGALVAAASWRLVSWGFSWLVAGGFTRYEAVYGSLGAVVGLLFWMYLSSWIVLLGAHLTSAIDREIVRRRQALGSD
jgi:membrane protein